MRLQLLFYPVTTTDLDVGLDPDHDGLVLSRDELAWHEELYLPRAVDRMSSEASPLDRADLTGLPQALVIASQCDPIAPQSSRFVAGPATAGVAVRLRTYPGMIHGFVQRPDQFTAAREALAQAGSALAEALGPHRPLTRPADGGL